MRRWSARALLWAACALTGAGHVRAQDPPQSGRASPQDAPQIGQLPAESRSAPSQAGPNLSFQSLLSQHGYADVRADAALSEAAAALLARLGGEEVDPQTASAHLKWLLARRGIADVQVRPFVRHTSGPLPAATGGWGEAQRTALISAVAPAISQIDRRRPPTHFGLALRGQSLALLLVHRGFVADAAIPQSPAPDATVRLSGALRPGYFAPWVMWAAPGRAIERLSLSAADRRIDRTFTFDAGPGIYGLELLADSQEGPVVLLNQRLYVGVEPPSQPVVILRPDRSAQAHVLWRQVQDWRLAAGLSPLVPVAALHQVAQGHAESLARAGRLSHVSADSGNLRSRLARVGIFPTLAAENLAHAPDAHSAFAAFLESPGHAQNLLLPQINAGGVAVHRDYWVLALAALPDLPAPAKPPAQERP